MSAKIPDGFDCTTCGKHHKFGAYVAAHSQEELVHTCDECGAKHTVIHYQVNQIKPGKTKA